MNFKLLFLPLAIIFSPSLVIGQDTVTIFSNNKKLISFLSNENTADKTIHLNNIPKKIMSLLIQVDGVHTTRRIYRQTLEVTGAEDNNSTMVELKRGHSKKFNITASAKNNSFFNGGVIKLYLVLNPTSPRMKIRSQRIFLATLTTR
ncbi:MAG: hypothetical protein ABIT07_01490 [Ferruginibacter sp.]